MPNYCCIDRSIIGNNNYYSSHSTIDLNSIPFGGNSSSGLHLHNPRQQRHIIMPGVTDSTTQQQQQQASCSSNGNALLSLSSSVAVAAGASASAVAASGLHLGGGAGGRKLFLQPNGHSVLSSALKSGNNNNILTGSGNLISQAAPSTAVNDINNAAATAAAVLARQYQQQLQNQHQQQHQQIESSVAPSAINNSNALLLAAALAASGNNNSNDSSSSNNAQQFLAINSALHAVTNTPAISSGISTSASITLPLPTSYSTIAANGSSNIPRSHSLLLPGAGGVVNMVGGLGINPAAVGGSVPEFLYQLTKMLTDTSNRDIIEWSTHNGNRGRIEVHNPQRLESQVLGRYFRHTRYSSFQRQLNYFGFRKIAGKGKMSPCSYLNDMATADICSLLLMRRKNNHGGGGKQQQQQEQLDGQQHPPSQGITTAAAPTISAMMIHDDNNKRRFCDFAPSSSSSTTSSSDGCYTMVSADNSNSHQGNSSNSSSSNASKNDIFSSMAANVAMNIANSKVNKNGIIDQGDRGGRDGGGSNILVSSAVGNGNKRSKLPQNQQQHQQQVAPVTSSSVPPSSNVSGRGYTVAIGKGVRHQLNGYLRQCGNNSLINYGGLVSSNNSDSSGGVVALQQEQQQRQEQQQAGTKCTASSTTAITPASSNSTSTSSTNAELSNHSTAATSNLETPSSSFLSYLAHPSAKLASSAPAPLKFLDPSELGMSIENSLNQLRDNFALAATNKPPSMSTSLALSSSSSSTGIVSGGAVDSDTTSNVDSSSSTHQALSHNVLATSTSSSTASSSSMPSSSTRQNKNDAGMQNHQAAQQHGEHYSPSVPPHRVSPTTNYMGRTSMLSRDDSLINLAMLPMLDTVNDVSGGEATGNNDAGGTDADVLPTANESASSTVITASSLGNYDSNPITTNNNNNDNNGESMDCMGGNDYISGMFSRDDSLINLLATVDAGSDSNVGTHITPRQQPVPDGDGWGGDGCGGEMFGFIDFPG